MEAEFYTGHTPCPSQEESGEELSVLPRHTKVVITGNNRTKSVLVGLQGVVKKAVGLGGWHWLVLKNGVEVKLQRNALSVLETPSGDEDEDEIVYTSFYGTSDLAQNSTSQESKGFNIPGHRYLVANLIVKVATMTLNPMDIRLERSLTESKFVKTWVNYPVEILEALRSGECQSKPNEGTNG